MKEVNGYNISEKEFKQISKWTEDVYNITVPENIDKLELNSKIKKVLNK